METGQAADYDTKTRMAVISTFWVRAVRRCQRDALQRGDCLWQKRVLPARGSPASEMRAVCTNLADSEERVGKKKLITSVRERDQKQGNLGSWQRWPLDTQLLLKHSWSHSLWESERMLSKKVTVLINHLFSSFICRIICFPLYYYLQIKKRYLGFSFKLHFIKALWFAKLFQAHNISTPNSTQCDLLSSNVPNFLFLRPSCSLPPWQT